MKDKDIEAKIDDLAEMVARGFTEVRGEMHDIREDMATKADLADLREEFKGDMIRLRGDIDIMLDRHIGTFRKDYDELAERVKRLEQLVLK
jgi:hypothetical protein